MPDQPATPTPSPAPEPKKGAAGAINGFLNGLTGFWNTHHTTRKGLEMAFYGFVAAAVAALLSDPLIWADTTKWYVPVGMLVLTMLSNWAKHNLGQK
jgi:hypothetical protein